MVIYMEESINEQAVKDDIVNEQMQTFAAVPIHFRPGEGKSKLIKLVIPGIEPPLGFFEVTGGTPEELKLTMTDGPSSDNSGDGDGVEDEVSQTEDSHTPPEESDDKPDFTETDDVKTDDDTEDLPDEVEEMEAEESEEIEHPHEDDNGDPVSGFLLGSEEHQPLVILVRPAKDQTSQEAMEEESSKHPEHRPGSLDEATKLLGHNPLTSEDN